MPLLDDEALNALTGRAIGCAIEVHRCLGPGLLESVYAPCLVRELKGAQMQVRTDQLVPLVYKDQVLGATLKLDLVVDATLVIEVKAVQAVAPVHVAQLLTYLKLGRYPIGLLINFNVPLLKDGVTRVVNGEVLRTLRGRDDKTTTG